MGYRFDESAGFGGGERRVSSRLRLYAPGFLSDAHGGLITDCLVRDIGTAGIQIRVSSETPIPGSCYLVNLATRVLFQVQPVWRRKSLTGLSFDALYIVGPTLPAHFAFIPRLCEEARHRRLNRLLTLGFGREDALRACGLRNSPNA